jgi:L-alanine-DL-glutamate epimerase-like enolase superfamily enzyme
VKEGLIAMKLRHKIISLQLKHTFRTSRESSDFRRNVLCHIEFEDLIGVGEAAPSAYYGQDADSASDALERMAGLLGDDPFRLESVLADVARLLPHQSAARAALDIALHDIVAKSLGVPLYRLLGLDPADTPVTSVTVGLDRPEIMQEKVRELGSVPIIKIKVGGEHDEQVVRAIREITPATIRIDANAAWTASQALEKISALQDYDIEFVEQPLAADDREGLRWLRKRTGMPIVLDESVRTAEDIPRLVGCAHGINIKLMKCGGLREALRIIHVARAFGFQIMLGCMVESSVAITAAAQLSPLVDFADLDGHLLIENDPYEGVQVIDGKLVLPDRPGIGVHRRSPEEEGRP